MKKFKNISVYILYFMLCALIAIFSYGFVDANSPFKNWPFLYHLVHFQRGITAAIYIVLISSLFGIYGWVLWLVKKKKIMAKQVWHLVGLTVVILFFSFPAFSYDIFNYIATAKMTFFYHENPYIVMPIEIPNEPMLSFMHAANKTALYGPFWILLTFLPYFAGFGHLLLTVFTFKALMTLFYLGLVWLIWKMSKENLWSLAVFALNPLVALQTLVSAHNDAVMMFFALLSFYFLKKKRRYLSILSLFLSIMIKFATIFLLPVFFYVIIKSWLHKKIFWRRVWFYGACSMLLVFLLSPLREEIYSWYFIWPLTFTSFLLSSNALVFISIVFSFGLMFRIVPFLYTRSWLGVTPIAKKIATFLPPILSVFVLRLKKWEKRN